MAVADPNRLDLNLLGVLVALLDEGSVTRAAAKLGTSQPAVSGALARLRTYFGDPLFVRCAGGVAPTPRGAALASSARGILRRVDDELLRDERFQPETARRPVTVALSDVGEIVFLPPLIRHFALVAPRLPIQSVNLRPAELAGALAEGEVDLAVGYFPDLQENVFYQQRLFSHYFVCLLRAGHPVQADRLTLAQFLALPHAVVQSEGRSQEIFERFLKSRGLERRIALYTPHFLSLPKVISETDMVVTVPHAIGLAYGTAANNLRVALPPFEAPRIELKQHWHRKYHKDARNVWLRRTVSALFNDATDRW